MPSARSRSTARTPCLPAPMETEGTGPSSLHSSRPANSTVDPQAYLADVFARVAGLSLPKTPSARNWVREAKW